jgi:uncharacterized protein (DUF1919 family)
MPLTIISNNCLGAYTYKLLGLEYASPFIWSQTFLHDMLKIVKDFDSMDFQNISMIPAANEYIPEYRSNGSYAVQMENAARSYFIHYKDKILTETNWKRRAERIDKNNVVFYLMSSKPKIDTVDLVEEIQEECLRRNYRFVYLNTNKETRFLGKDFSDYIEFKDNKCPVKLACMALPYFKSELDIL